MEVLLRTPSWSPVLEGTVARLLREGGVMGVEVGSTETGGYFMGPLYELRGSDLTCRGNRGKTSK